MRPVNRNDIHEHLDDTVDFGFIPELGKHTEGKVRDIHDTGDELILVASDRVSAFDRVLSRSIPYKGAVLNHFTEWAMEKTEDIIPNALVDFPDPNVMVQKKLRNIGFECVVRGHMWGSLASAYERGDRVKCGAELPDDLIRYQQLPEPIFTPTTKAHEGHDEDITLDAIVDAHGKEIAEQIRDKSLELFERGAELARDQGLILVDTKFEFGLDEDDNLHLIDEVFTPDSSRYCSVVDHENKFHRFEAFMESGAYPSARELLKAHPEFKVTELSKQYVRDIVQDGSELTDKQVVHTAMCYIDLFEQLTGWRFGIHSEMPVRERIMYNLEKKELAAGGCVVPIAKRTRHRMAWEPLKNMLDEMEVPHIEPREFSPHRETEELLYYVKEMDERSLEPLIYMVLGNHEHLPPLVSGVTDHVVLATYKEDISRYPDVPACFVTDGYRGLAETAKRIIEHY